ncbi:MAG: hypothetical protein H7329_10695 [Opitutaceae bacterium]|nr:hypothetical protein [Cytophagales bacterium]
MQIQDYLSGSCPFLIKQNELGAILISLTNGKDEVSTILTAEQVNELLIPVKDIKEFSRVKFLEYYNLYTGTFSIPLE